MNESLFDVAELAELASIERDLNVRFTLRGGIVRRFVADRIIHSKASERDLCSLTPFSADIDLTHSGKPETTPAILAAIHERIPLAECVRWEIRSEAEDAVFAATRSHNSFAPINSMALNRNGLVDPHGGYNDIESRQYRFERNRFYRDSPLFSAGRDLEMFGAILYLRAVAELEVDGRRGELAKDAVTAVFASARTSETVGRLQQSAYCRMRLRYLLKGLAVSSCSPSSRAIWEETELLRLLAFIDDIELPDRLERVTPVGRSVVFVDAREPAAAGRATFSSELDIRTDRALTSTAHLLGDFFRLPSHVPIPSLRPDIVGFAALPEEIFVRQGLPWTVPTPGIGKSNRPHPTLAVSEMIHFAVLEPPQVGANPYSSDEDFSAVMFVRSAALGEETGVATPLTSVTHRAWQSNDARPHVLRLYRMQCGSLLERLPERSELSIAFVERDVRRDELGIGTTRQAEIVPPAAGAQRLMGMEADP